MCTVINLHEALHIETRKSVIAHGHRFLRFQSDFFDFFPCWSQTAGLLISIQVDPIS